MTQRTTLGDLISSKHLENWLPAKEPVSYPGYVSLAAEIKANTYNTRRGDAERRVVEGGVADKFVKRTPFNKARQLFNREMLLDYYDNGKYVDQKVIMYFTKDVFIIVHDFLNSDLNALMTDFGYRRVSGTLSDVAHTAGSFSEQANDKWGMFKNNGEWPLFGNRRLLSSYQAIANHASAWFAHPGHVKRRFPMTEGNKRPAWSSLNIRDLLPQYKSNEIVSKHQGFVFRYADDEVLVETENTNDISAFLPDAMVQTEARGPYYGPAHCRIIDPVALVNYLNNKYPKVKTPKNIK